MATRLPLLFLKVVRWTFLERSFSSFSFKDSKIFSSSQTRALCKNIKKKNPSAFSVAQVMTMRSKQRIASEILNHSWIMNTWHTNGKLMNLAILLEKASRPSQRIENSSYVSISEIGTNYEWWKKNCCYGAEKSISTEIQAENRTQNVSRSMPQMKIMICATTRIDGSRGMETSAD